MMQYKDEVTDEIETIWNSRDGVTPYCITSKAGNKATHVNWQQDKYDPFHKLKLGERLFVDATPDLVREKATDYVTKYWNADGNFCMKDHSAFKNMSMQQAIDYFISEWSGNGQPWLREES